MSVNRIKVANTIWQWILSTIVLSDEQKSALHNWSDGIKTPTFIQLENLSKKINIPFGYFFLKNPPAEEYVLLKYRTVDSLSLKTPSRNLLDIIRQMENTQEWMHEHLIINGADKINFVGDINPNDDVISVTKKIRLLLDIEKNWYENSTSLTCSYNLLKKAINDVGIIIMMTGIVGNNTKRKLNIEEFRAFTLIDDYAPLIFINSIDSISGKIFSLLHELVHIGIAKDSFYDSNIYEYPLMSAIETFCNGVTAEILAPMDLFIENWYKKTYDNQKKIIELSNYFKCSKIVIARRAYDNRLIKDTEYASVVMESNKGFVNKKNSGGHYYKTQATRIDHRFLLALDSSVKEGKTLYSDAFRLTNTNRNTFDNLVMELRGERN